MKILFCLFLFILGTLEAVLPPFYTSLNEYKALLSDERLSEYLESSEPIREIKREEQGFIIVTSKHSLKVEVNYESQDRPGPGKFNLFFYTPEPL